MCSRSREMLGQSDSPTTALLCALLPGAGASTLLPCQRDVCIADEFTLQKPTDTHCRVAPPRSALPLKAPCVPLPAAGPGRQEHGDARGRHPALRRRKLCLSAGAAAVLLGGCCRRHSFSVLFSTEFKENGHNNDAPAVPVSMGTVRSLGT